MFTGKTPAPLYTLTTRTQLLPYLAAIFSLMTACQSSVKDEAYADVPQASIEKGLLLAEQHCASCHQLPDPSQLDAQSWEKEALPAMGPLMGIFQYKDQTYPYRGDPEMKGPGYLATNPMVTPEEWQNIVDYFTASAPATLPTQERPSEISMGLPQFQVTKPELQYIDSHSCFVKIRNGADVEPLVVSDAISMKTYFLNEYLQPVDSITTSGPLVQIDFADQNVAVACNVGLMNPNDGEHGSALQLQRIDDKWEPLETNLLEGLHRPMQVLPTDLNNDTRTDYLICEFGYMQGGLSWMENKGDGQYEKHVISKLPGALKAYPLDHNGDGLGDILALFAQGEEGIFLFTNLENGEFETRELLRFPAIQGSSYFELADFNQDGLWDIVYTAGDNADYTTILKPYHGVYIFINQGNYRFQQELFFPIHGCYKAMARDFDGDGDLDLATIAYYADFTSQPEEGFVYLENEGDLQFTPRSSAELQVGRWISMDVGDIDRDDRPDIILGNFVQPSKFANPSVNWAAAPPVLVLKNVGP